jgi:ABC-2 type transport system ATP-binding protein
MKTTASASAIEVADLRKRYREGLLGGRTFDALKGVSFQVRPGEIFGLLGPNGAGKTTIIKILLGIIHKSGGRAELLGQPAGHRASRLRVGYLPEQLRIPTHHNAYTALDYYGRLSGMTSREVRDRRGELLAEVGLPANRHRDRVRKYSKGMLQRLGLAQALLHDPELVVLDEPTDGLDPVGRRQIRDLLGRLRDAGKTVFLNSHLLQEVQMICDRVAILDRGVLRGIGTPDELAQSRQPGLRVRLMLAAEQSVLATALANFTAALQPCGGGVFETEIELPDQPAVDACVDRLRQQGISIVGLSRQRATLEDTFLALLDQQEAPITAIAAESP